MMQIEEQLKLLPDKPGVYFMKDELEEIIYVGKAKSLKKRVRSYFRKGNHTYKTRVLIENIMDFDYVVTDTEVEAYILEANMIKKYQPRFNIRLKDDKTYPYIKVTVQEDFPRVYKTRIIRTDGARYYGPFTNVDDLYKTIDILKELYSLRSCRKELKAEKPLSRPCLNYHIGKCLGPCIGAIDRENYHRLVEQVCLFLSGHQEELIKRVEKMMISAAEEKNFEKAAKFRDTIQALKRLAEQQKVMTTKKSNQDVITLAIDEDGQACVQILLIRNGRLIGQDHYLLEGSENNSAEEIMESFLPQYYDQVPQLPEEILLGTEIKSDLLLTELIQKRREKNVKILFPERGEKRRLLDLSLKNAQENLKKEKIKNKYQKMRTTESVTKLAQYLGMEKEPFYIEGFDISNIQGSDTVASLVVFKGGLPSKKDYRRFKIKTVEGPNDFASMQEVVTRRYSRLLAEKQRLPDLILIDGGKGQLKMAYDVLKSLGLGKQTVIGLAKREEEVFLPNRSDPIIIPRKSAALHLLQRVRDEAHRFAISYHRKLRSRRLTHSMLDDIPRVGPKRRQALLNYFGSLAEIRKASISKLSEVEGVSHKTARLIYDYLRKNTRP